MLKNLLLLSFIISNGLAYADDGLKVDPYLVDARENLRLQVDPFSSTSLKFMSMKGEKSLIN